jgi:V8-like Glu-specific endopeptidase
MGIYIAKFCNEICLRRLGLIARKKSNCIESMKRSILLLLCLTMMSKKSIAQSSLSEIACKPDCSKRVKITDFQAPYSYVCFMYMQRGRKIYRGTGFLIHPRVVLTAGHNLATSVFRKVRKVDLYFGSRDSTTYKANQSVSLKKNINKFFKNFYWINGKICRDFSIIILPDSAVFEKVGGHFEVLPVSHRSKSQRTIKLTGSPGDKDDYEIWHQETNHYQLSAKNGGQLLYDIYTQPRNSGSPVWITAADRFQAIGVHSRSMDSCNAGKLLDKETYEQIAEWCRKAGIDMGVGRQTNGRVAEERHPR